MNTLKIDNNLNHPWFVNNECAHNNIKIVHYSPITSEPIEGVCLDCDESVFSTITWSTA